MSLNDMTSKKPRIAIIITRSDIGGAQNHVRSILAGFSSECDLLLVSGSEGLLTEYARQLRVQVEVCPSIDSYNVVGATFRLLAVLRRFDPGLVHTHSALASMSGRIAAKVLGIKTLYTVHGWHFAGLDVGVRRRLQVAMEKIMRPLTDFWITVSEFDLRLGLSAGILEGGRSKCIPNGIPDEQIERTERPFGQLRVVFVGRASYQKNIYGALQVLENAGEDVRMTIYTSGAGAAELFDLVSISKAKERCEIVLDEPRAGSLLGDYDVMLVTSRYEGMPLSVIEGLRAGLCIFSTDVCGMSELVGAKNGRLYPMTDFVGMAKSLNQVALDDVGLKSMQRESRRLYAEKFSEKLMVQAISHVYHTMI
ncbi:glycosyltransferase [Arenicella xantha]|uniref:Glycosyltransferase involved in cell wall biosynthesis n=1 Tax=Arenicella xantha TaxID=644221 RepID=A0A395JM34_9GAMM|nr:glycosyltransferase [Arenicella xantha]RBP51485.1 glycosyltransferase involved in cell wall biosynthesis [Arenicella xantha]